MGLCSLFVLRVFVSLRSMIVERYCLGCMADFEGMLEGY